MAPASVRLPAWQIITMVATAAFSAGAIVLDVAGVSPVAIFGVAAIATIGLAWLVGLSTEQLAATSGAKVSALLNAAFGNIAELVLILLAVSAGLQSVAIASIAGSVIGNALFVLGAAFLVGGLRHGRQAFSRHLAGINSVLLLVAVLGVVIPTTYAAFSGADADHVQSLSVGVAIIFIVLYVIYVYSFLKSNEVVDDEHPPALMPWSRTAAITTLLIAGVGVGVLGEVLIGSLEPTAESLGISPVFMGLIAIPVIGNLAEHLVAVQLAYRNKMDFAMNIAMGSTLQVVMLIAPIIVLVSPLFGAQVPMVFTPLELVALGGGALVIAVVAADGESNWIEGAALMAVYVMVGLAAFLWPVVA
ncbi:MAG: calcium/proton exchanger [Thermoleophilia bacterium]|nr:calcium/proton exchanger [Thermoleophilia bacterium]